MDDEVHDHQAESPTGTRGDSRRTGFWRSRIGIAAIVFLAIGGALLIAEHRVHAAGVLSYLPLLALPFLHLFMHAGHGSHGGRGGHQGHGGDGGSKPAARSDTTTERRD
jgi:hypothetical protein